MNSTDAFRYSILGPNQSHSLKTWVLLWDNSLLSLNQNVHHIFHKSPPLVPVLRQIDPVTPLLKPFCSKKKFLFMSHPTHAKNFDQLILHSFIWRGQSVKFLYFGIYSILLPTSRLLDSHFVISNCYSNYLMYYRFEKLKVVSIRINVF